MTSKLHTSKWGIAIAVIACGVFLLLRFGGYILVNTNPLPPHAQVAVVLNGSAAGLRARTAGAIKLLESGIVSNLLMSVPPQTYWGESVPVVAHQYFAKQFGAADASKIDYCISAANSTFEEAHAVTDCLQAAGWTRVIIVTSNYHTRRAGRIWRKAAAKAKPPLTVWLHGVADGDYQPRGWWSKRIYAKTWLLEFSKLVWETCFGPGPWKSPNIKGRLVTPSMLASGSGS